MLDQTARRCAIGKANNLGRIATRIANGRKLIRSSHRGMERSEVAHHALILVLLVSMDGLCVLTKVIKTRKLLAAVTTKRALSCVFSDVTREVLAPRENHATFAIAPALEGLCWSWAVAFRT